MNDRRLVDTKLIVRYLVQDHKQHAEIAERLFAACDRGELVLLVLPAVVAECVFVLESFYNHPRDEITKVLTALLSSPGIELDALDIHLDALSRFAGTRVHFVDCVVAATAASTAMPAATFDKDFKKFPDVTVDVDPSGSLPVKALFAFTFVDQPTAVRYRLRQNPAATMAPRQYDKTSLGSA